jgi:zinc transporter ZupT
MKGFNTAAVSGLAEPLAVVVLALLLPSGQLPHAWVEMVRGAQGPEASVCGGDLRGRLGILAAFTPSSPSRPRPRPRPRPLSPTTFALPPALRAAQMLAAVGGIMAFIAFHELLPLALEHAGKTRAVAAMFAGMALMSFNLYAVHTYFGMEG